MAFPVGPVVYAIYVNEILQNEFPLDVELRQEWGMHDLFFIRIEVPRIFTGMPSSKLWQENAPVRIIWGRRPDNILTWYGYVNHRHIASDADSGSKALQITYVLIGTSKPMNTDKTRTWGQVTGTYMAKKIASEYGFRAILSTSDWVLPYEVQANESDFKFLNRMADKIGFRFWVSNATLYFTDPFVVLQSNNGQAVPEYSLDKRYTLVDTIRHFSMSQGDNLPGVTKASRNIFGIDKNSGRVFQVQADTDQLPSVTQTFTDWPVEDISYAKQIIQAKQNRSQFWLSAEAELFGTSVLYPGKLLYLTGLQLPQDAQGYWMAGSSCHILKASGTTVTTSDKYITRVTLMRNNANLIPNLKNTAKISPEFVPCRLLGGKWRSAQATVLYDGIQVT